MSRWQLTLGLGLAALVAVALAPRLIGSTSRPVAAPIAVVTAPAAPPAPSPPTPATPAPVIPEATAPAPAPVADVDPQPQPVSIPEVQSPMAELPPASQEFPVEFWDDCPGCGMG